MLAICPGGPRLLLCRKSTPHLEALTGNTNKTIGLLLMAGSESSVGGLLE